MSDRDGDGASAHRAIRLFVESALAEDAVAALTPGQAHYLKNVMRRAPDDRIRLFNGRDGEWEGCVENLARSGGSIRLMTQRAPQRRAPDLWLLFAPLKATQTRFVVEKATEMGARALHPIKTRHGQTARINDERLRAHAVEAAEQCGRLDVPAVAPLSRLDDLLDAWPDDRRLLVCDPEAGTPVADALANGSATAWAILIGPEGGLSGDEQRRLEQHSAVVRAHLGPRILRAETAAVAALACWQAMAGDWTTGDS